MEKLTWASTQALDFFDVGVNLSADGRSTAVEPPVKEFQSTVTHG